MFRHVCQVMSRMFPAFISARNFALLKKIGLTLLLFSFEPSSCFLSIKVSAAKFRKPWQSFSFSLRLCFLFSFLLCSRTGLARPFSSLRDSLVARKVGALGKNKLNLVRHVAFLLFGFSDLPHL